MCPRLHESSRLTGIGYENGTITMLSCLKTRLANLQKSARLAVVENLYHSTWM